MGLITIAIYDGYKVFWLMNMEYTSILYMHIVTYSYRYIHK